MGQTADLAPADKKMYALRDVTATVDSIPLIASSIMSKKLASGADAIVLDVKTGSGAFMKNFDDALSLAETMVTIGNKAGKKTSAVITDMNQPLGRAVGNSLEVIEAIEMLNGNGPKDLAEDCFALGRLMLLSAGVVSDGNEAEKMLKATIENGSALEKFEVFVASQGGDPSFVRDTGKFKKAEYEIPVYAPISGYVTSIKTDEVGVCSLILGGGRETKESVIDLSVGLILNKKLGDKVEKGDELCVLHANSKEKAETARERFLNAYTISDRKPKEHKTVYAEVSLDGTVVF